MEWLTTDPNSRDTQRGRSTVASFTQEFYACKKCQKCESSIPLAAKGTEIQPTFFGLESRWCKILSMCDQGTAALGQLFKDAEKDPYAFPWDVMAAQVDFFLSKVCLIFLPPTKSFSIIGIIMVIII